MASLNETGSENDLKEHWGIRNVIKINRKSPPSGFKKYLYHLGNLVMKPHIPLTFIPYFESNVVTAAMKAVKGDRYDYILLDGLHLGALFLKKKLPVHSKIIYRAHNIESDLWKRSYEENNNLILKLLFLYQSRLVSKIESSIIQQAALVAPIAEEDKNYIKKIHPDSVVELVPLGLNFSNALASPEAGEIQFLFIGKLDWAPNQDGLKWLLDEVWPQVIKRRPEAKLKIVGSGNGSWLNDYKHLPGVIIRGFVKNIEDAYRDCHFTVVPVFYGSGTRIKVIESFVMNRRLISTSMGVQGAHLRVADYERAETKEEWINLLSSITYNDETETKALASREYMSSHFCEHKIGQKFYKWLTTVS